MRPGRGTITGLVWFIYKRVCKSGAEVYAGAPTEGVGLKSGGVLREAAGLR